jgi:uncharacterized membrane protein YdjX (TVP38/TMEM64 family)
MMHSKCGSDGNVMKLCPVSLGLAIGIVSFFTVLIWTLWVMSNGMPAMMVAMHVPVPTLGRGVLHALLALVKGFLFGFFVAFVYDLFACWFGSCCKNTDGKNEAGK